MNLSNPQFLYVILILPGLFGLTLTGEGLYRCVHEEWSGLVSIIFGLMFLVGVIVAYLFFSTYLGTKV
ncbi:MAG: hypothetical protein AAB546_04430 [Patescibacteria group bacterium]